MAIDIKCAAMIMCAIPASRRGAHYHGSGAYPYWEILGGPFQRRQVGAMKLQLEETPNQHVQDTVVNGLLLIKAEWVGEEPSHISK
jgi:hypothetical protein